MNGSISTIVLKVASRCNLNCSYCYIYNHEDKTYLDQPKQISDEVFDALLHRIKNHCDQHDHRMSIVFHGGEPTLIGVERMKNLCSRAEQFLGESLNQISIQTNGTLLDEDWADLFLEHNISVGVSIDGPAAIHDAERVTHSGRGSHQACVNGIELLRKKGVSVGALCVINPRFKGLETYRHFRQLDFNWINFLLPDVSHDTKFRLYGELGETPVADFLEPIFKEWISEDDPGIRIDIFWELIERILGGRGTTDCFGNRGMSYVIVNTDGSIEALDSLKVCEEGMAQSGLNVVDNDFDDLEKGLPLVFKAVKGEMPLCDTCRECEFVNVCGGGFLPHRYSRKNGFDNPSVWCRDIKKIIGFLTEFITASGSQPAVIGKSNIKPNETFTAIKRNHV